MIPLRLHRDLPRMARVAGRPLAGAAVLLCVLAATAPPLTAQRPGAVPDLSRLSERIIHESWTVEDGLPVNSVNDIVQTRDGYIWAATFDGLVRFDGVRFTVFNSATHEGLPSNRIIGLYEGRDGTLWLRTQGHLVRFRNDRFDYIGPDQGLTGSVYGVYEDPDGRTWVTTTAGLGQVRDDRFVTVLGGPIGRLITRVMQRRDGSVWAGTEGAGLFQLTGDPDGTTLQAIPVDPLDSVIVRILFEDPSGRLWIGTSDGIWSEQNGLTKLSSPGVDLREVNRFVYSSVSDATFAQAESGVFRLEPERVVPIDQRPRLVAVGRPMTVDAEGAIWHATGSELSRDGRTVLKLAPDLDDRLSSALVTTLVADREGSIWIGTRAAGLHRVRPSFITTLSEAEGLTDRNVYPIHQDQSGNIWIGSYGNGLSRIDRDGNFTSFTPARGYPGTIQTLYADRLDRLWVGALDGLFECALPEMTCTRDNSLAALNASVYALHEDRAGRLWAGFRLGPGRLEDGVWTAVPGWPDDAAVRAFAETTDSAIWMGTNGDGLVRYRNGTFTRVTAAGDGLPIDLVRALYTDADGWLWIGTEGRGLARLDPLAWSERSGRSDRRIVSIRTADGLFDEVIHQILEDDRGRLWMSTNRGIFWVTRAQLNDFAEGRIDHVRSTGYTERDGLRNREANGGVQPAGMRARDGRLWFPTQDGVAIVDPADIETGRIPPPVLVERVVAGDSVLLAGGAALSFGVDQRDIEIDYTALSFLEPRNIRFRYRLDPYDGDWVEAGQRRAAFYTRVPPGRYTFRVTASNDPGVWAGEERSVDLVFEPRFRETRGALVLGLASIGLIVAAGYRRRVGNLRRRERELSRVVEVRTAELQRNEKQLEERNAQLAAQADMLAELHEARSRLFANLSHEFRTPLTLILGPLNSILAGRHGNLPPSARDLHELMLRNGQRLLRLINQVLDLSSLQAGALSLKHETIDLVGFAQLTTRECAPLFEQRGIDLRFSSEAAELPCSFDSEQLEKVLLNLLSNAAKFTAPGGRVEVTVRTRDESAEIVVRDTGVGIAPEELEQVFDRFYQADSSSTRRFAGTGIGLALAKELVGLHGGEILAESTQGVGSTFTVRLPLAMTTGQPLATATAGNGIRRDRLIEAVSAALAIDSGPGPEQEAEETEDRTTVLVVDDNADVRTYVRSILEKSYRVIDARDGEEGLEAARTALPDVIVADVMMPRLDGLALGRALKTDPLTDAIPLILLTARAAPEDQVAGLETGADAYLVKPFEPTVLEARVANLLAQRRRLRERFRQGEETPPVTAADPPVALDTLLRPLVEARLADPDFGPDALATAADLSYHQLYRALRDELGVTPSGFIRRVRAECAAQLLRRRAGSVTEIAYSVGFESLSYFRRAFHERFAASPTKYLASEPLAR